MRPHHSLSPGDKIRQWKFLRTETIQHNKTYLFLCVCGKEKRFWKLSAVSRAKSCGCGTDNAGLTAKQRRSMLSRMQGYKNGAKVRRLGWSLTYEDFVKLVQQPCFYCGGAPKKWNCVEGAPSIQKDSPHIIPKDYEIEFTGVDRFDSLQGYTVDNTVPCCVWCNRAKSNLTFNDFKLHVERMHLWLSRKK